MSSAEKAIALMRDLAADRLDGVSTVVEVTLKFAVSASFARDELAVLTEDELHDVLAEGVDEMLGMIKRPSDGIEVGPVLSATDVMSGANIPLPGPATEVFAGYLGFEGVSIQAEFDVPVGASPAEKDAAFMAVLTQKANLDYVSMGVVPPVAAEVARAPGSADRLSAVAVAYRDSKVYGHDIDTGEKNFVCEINDQRTTGGRVSVTLAPVEGDLDDSLTVTAEVNRLPESKHDVPCVRLEMGETLVALFYKQGDSLIVRPEKGLRTSNTMLPGNEAAWIWE